MQERRPDPKRIKQLAMLELLGAIFIVAAGTCLHFVFEWSGRRTIAAMIAAVNESTWEHLKLVYWPTLLVSITEYILIRPSLPNFGFAKLASVLTMMVLIIVVAYGYAWLVGRHILLADISLFVAAVGIGQYVSFKLISREKENRAANWIGFALLIALAAAFAIFTFYPPHVFLFQDPITKQFGIVQE